LIRLPVYVNESIGRIIKIKGALTRERFGKEPSTKEIAEQLGWKPEKVQFLLDIAWKPLSWIPRSEMTRNRSPAL